MTKEELKAAIIANPHLHHARTIFPTHPELSIQTIANELKVKVEEVAAAMDASIVPASGKVVMSSGDLKGTAR